MSLQNQRAFRFRAFDTETKQWVIKGFHLFGEAKLFGMIEQWCAENNLGKPTLDRLLHDIHTTQYIGRVDRKGIDIYEGDIVLFNGKEYEVYYSDTTCGFFCKNPNEVTHFGFMWIENNGGCEVVGNIFERELTPTKK